MASEEQLSSFVHDGVKSWSLMGWAITIFQEYFGEVREVVVPITRKDSCWKGHWRWVASWATEVGFASLITSFDSWGQIVTTTEAPSLEEDEDFLGISLGEIVGSPGAIKAESSLTIDIIFLIDTIAIGEGHDDGDDNESDKYLHVII